MQNLPRRGQDSSEPPPSCIKMSCHWKPVTSAFVVYPFLAKYPSSFCATESACHCPELETAQKLPTVLQLQQLPYSKKIFCVYHVVGTVGICACMDSAQTYAAGIHLRIRLSTGLRAPGKGVRSIRIEEALAIYCLSSLYFTKRAPPLPRLPRLH